MNESSKKNPDLLLYFTANDEELDEEPTNNIKAKLIDNLKKIGAKDQLLMFVTVSAGAGKGTVIEVAQQFCFEFCRSMDIIWGEKTCLFAAITGCAAALFGGVTLHSAASLNSKLKNIHDEMMNTWEQVRILIIDEVSFSLEDQMDKLNAHLNHVRRKIPVALKFYLPTLFLVDIRLFSVEIFVNCHLSK